MPFIRQGLRQGLFFRTYATGNLTLRTTYRQQSSKDSVSYETARPFEEIPGPRGLPFIGTALEYTPFGRFPLRTNFRDSFMDRRKTYGNIYREKIGSRDFVIISNPEDIEKVFRNEGKYPRRDEVKSISTYRRLKKMPDGIILLEGEEWHRVRGAVQKSMMRPKTVGAYASLQDEVSRDLVDVMRALSQREGSGGQVQNFINYVCRWALDSISVVVLDKRLGCLTLDDLEQGSDAQMMIDAVHAFFGTFSQLQVSRPLYKYISTPTWRKFEKAMDQWHTVAEKLLKEKLAKSMTEEGKPAESETDFLQSLLSRKELTFEEAMMMAVELLVAGIDTTGHTLMFNLFCLAKHPEAQEKLYQEIMEVIPPGQPIDDKMLNKMHYLRAVVKETFRVYPTTPHTLRILNQDIILSGYSIPANTNILMAYQSMSKHPEYYPEPEVYRPERWLRDDESSTVPPFALLPFGFGPRSCIGRRFAEQELYLGLIRILQNFHVGWKGEDMKQIFKIVYFPDKDNFVFHERA